MPDPESDTARGELAALLMMLRLPTKLPLVAGTNVALSKAACPAARVSGNDNPGSLNPAPLMLICERVALELPVFVTVTLCVAVAPVVMLPKLSALGDALSWTTGETPVPASGTMSGEFGVLFTNVRLVEKLPAAGGLKPTVNAADPPGATERGKDRPEKLKPVPPNKA